MKPEADAGFRSAAFIPALEAAQPHSLQAIAPARSRQLP
jgi:hypothetical protein